MRVAYRGMKNMLNVIILANVVTSCALASLECDHREKSRSSFVCENVTLGDVKMLPNYAYSIEVFDSRYVNITANSFEKFDSLKSLSLVNCSVSNLESSAFEGLTDLRSLNLSRNNLRAIKSNAFVGLRKLEKLDLSYNSIEIIDERSFGNLTTIRIFNLRNNNLTNIDASLLRTLARAATLDFRSNSLRCIATHIFNNTKLKWFYIGNNPWEEECWATLSRHLYYSGIYYGRDWAFDSLTEDRLVWNITSVKGGDLLEQHQAEEKAQVAREAEGWKDFYELAVEEYSGERQKLKDISANIEETKEIQLTSAKENSLTMKGYEKSGEPLSNHDRDIIVWIISLAKVLHLWPEN